MISCLYIKRSSNFSFTEAAVKITLNTLSLVILIFGSCYLKEFAADVKTFILDPGSICWFSAAHVCNMFTSVDLLKFTISKTMHHARAYMVQGDVGVLCVQCRR